MKKVKALTRAKLRRFVKIRNGAEYNSNLQFMSDCLTAGFDIGQLGKAQKFKLDGFTGYLWTPWIVEVSERCNVGKARVRLVEFGRGMRMEGEDETAEMFSLLDRKAEYIETEVESA